MTDRLLIALTCGLIGWNGLFPAPPTPQSLREKMIESQHAKVAGNEGTVAVERIPQRRVASLGAKGSYSRGNFEKNRDTLVAWIAKQTDIEAAGEPYGVFWHGPFTPWFAKRFEVHVPVRSKPAATTRPDGI